MFSSSTFRLELGFLELMGYYTAPQLKDYVEMKGQKYSDCIQHGGGVSSRQGNIPHMARSR